MSRKAHEAVSRISDDEWRDIALDLERHALSVSRHLRWRTGNPIELPGETVTSIVTKAIEKLFCGDRDWDPDKEPDIKEYLRGVIDSLLNHLAESHDNTLVTVAPEPGLAGLCGMGERITKARLSRRLVGSAGQVARSCLTPGGTGVAGGSSSRVPG